jgi:hypothetical protein
LSATAVESIRYEKALPWPCSKAYRDTWSARERPRLEKKLQRYANFAFDAANGLLKGAGKNRIGLFDPTGNCSFLSV